VVEIVEEDRESRPDVPAWWGKGPWKEIVILPFDKTMSRLNDGGWLQWGPEECIKIPGWTYCVLGLLWPVIRWFYTRPLKGQNTDK